MRIVKPDPESPRYAVFTCGCGRAIPGKGPFRRHEKLCSGTPAGEPPRVEGEVAPGMPAANEDPELEPEDEAPETDEDPEDAEEIAEKLKLDGDSGPPAPEREPSTSTWSVAMHQRTPATASTLTAIGTCLDALTPLGPTMQRASLQFLLAHFGELRDPTPLLATDRHGHLSPGAHP